MGGAKYVCKETLNTLLNLILPAVCYNCNRRITHQKECLCPYCFSYLERKKGFLKGEDELGKRYFFKAASMYDYGHISRQLLHVYKYESIKEIGRYFGNQAISVLKADYPEFINVDGILSVPMHKKRFQDRNYDHVHLIVKIISKALLLNDFSYNITKIVNSPKQSLLDFGDRIKNPENSFKIKDRQVFKDKTLLLIDDIFTTGATVNALCKELTESGVKKVYVFCIAAGSMGRKYKIKKSVKISEKITEK